MKFLTILFFSILIFSCNRNNSLARVDENISLNITHNNQGIYLPEYYLESLLETRSHMIASKMFRNLPNNDANVAIVISENMVSHIFSFHEAGERNIIKINENEIIMEKHFQDDKTAIFIIDDDTIKNENGIIYHKINDDVDNWNSRIGSYITNIIFGDDIFINDNGERIVRMGNGNISFNDTEYSITLDTVFSNPNYDYLFNREYGTINFRRNGNVINMYQRIINEERVDDPQMNFFSEYIIVDEFRK